MARSMIERHPVAARIGAHGWSYGGDPTLVALTRRPDLFAADARLAGMSDVRTFFAGTEPWTAATSVTSTGEGHTAVGSDQLVELSERVAAWFDRWL